MCNWPLSSSVAAVMLTLFPYSLAIVSKGGGDHYSFALTQVSSSGWGLQVVTFLLTSPLDSQMKMKAALSQLVTTSILTSNILLFVPCLPLQWSENTNWTSWWNIWRRDSHSPPIYLPQSGRHFRVLGHIQSHCSAFGSIISHAPFQLISLNLSPINISPCSLYCYIKRSPVGVFRHNLEE